MQKRINYLLGIIFLMLPQIMFSQKKQSVQLKLISNIDSVMVLDKDFSYIRTLKFNIKNYSITTVGVLNVPIKLFYFNVSMKVGDKYFSIDSNCSFMPQPIIPKEGLRQIKLKTNEKKEVSYVFPPGCMTKIGDYKIQFKFKYYLQKKQYWAKTGWYKIKVVE